MAVKITCYLDCGAYSLFPSSISHANYGIVSPYSYYALLHLERNRQTLEAHNVEIELVPVFSLPKARDEFPSLKPYQRDCALAKSKYDH